MPLEQFLLELKAARILISTNRNQKKMSEEESENELTQEKVDELGEVDELDSTEYKTGRGNAGHFVIFCNDEKKRNGSRLLN